MYICPKRRAKDVAYDFFKVHGLAIRAVGIKVANAAEAYAAAVGAYY